ncbi:NUDIX domain-containing protein [Streptomyces sp. NPDC003077]|uniref:NUDIX domain-containing protein n=1 Tax=Streptomyces sp. NPDC003077 TaxID=3154443 RepID=UPI0033B61DE0
MKRSIGEWAINRAPERHLYGYAFMHTSDGRFLVLKREGEGWVLPGGPAESGELAVSACMSHALAATGITVTPHGILTVDHPSACTDIGGFREAVFIIFDCGPYDNNPDQYVRLDVDHYRDHRWVTAEDMAEISTGSQQRRLTAALTALRTGTVQYLNNGRPATAAAP